MNTGDQLAAAYIEVNEKTSGSICDAIFLVFPLEPAIRFFWRRKLHK